MTGKTKQPYKKKLGKLHLHKHKHNADPGQKKQNRQVLSTLIKGINDKCYHCGKDVFRNPAGVQYQYHNTATVDHIYSRRDLRRYLVKEKDNIVISCHECNDGRNTEESRILATYMPDETVDILAMLKEKNN